MNVLIFGGTRFMGRYVLRALLDVGIDVTIANRGTRAENKGAHNVICDRSQPRANNSRILSLMLLLISQHMHLIGLSRQETSLPARYLATSLFPQALFTHQAKSFQ